MNDESPSASGSARSTSPSPQQPAPPASAPLAPLQNPKYRHISRSAAKRESVQMLGSIKDLQMHFARAGLVEHRPGAGAGVKGLGGIDEGEDEENVPPRSGPSRERRPWKDVELPKIDPAHARREARGTIARLRNIWGISGGSGSMVASPSFAGSFPLSPTTPVGRTRKRETGTVLVDTAKAIRRVRELALSMTMHSRGAGGRRVSGGMLVVPKTKARSGFSTPSRPSSGMPRAVSYGTGGAGAGARERSGLGQEVREDGMGELRKAALEVLAGLRVLEERLREVGKPLSPTRAVSPGVSSESSGPGTDSTRPTSTTFTEPDHYDSDEGDYSFNAIAQESAGAGQTWEERIVAEGREYRDLEEEEDRVDGVREGVRRWIGVVEGFFRVREGDVGELEEWAREGWEGRELDQLHAFLLAHLPLDVQIMLPPPTAEHFRQSFLARLADGLILTQAYNSAILSSSKPWGYIPAEDIHDTLQSDTDGDEPRAEKDWTFRKVANLTCWAAALRLRYNLPINMPTHSSTLTVPPAPPRSDSVSPNPTPSIMPSVSPVPGGPGREPRDRAPPRRKDTAPRYDFEPLRVAKRDEGWEGMFEGLLGRWVGEVVREAREEVEGRGG